MVEELQDHTLLDAAEHLWYARGIVEMEVSSGEE